MSKKDKNTRPDFVEPEEFVQWKSWPTRRDNLNKYSARFGDDCVFVWQMLTAEQVTNARKYADRKSADASGAAKLDLFAEFQCHYTLWQAMRWPTEGLPGGMPFDRSVADSPEEIAKLLTAGEVERLYESYIDFQEHVDGGEEDVDWAAEMDHAARPGQIAKTPPHILRGLLERTLAHIAEQNERMTARQTKSGRQKRNRKPR